jgi:hypothetical protein
VSVKDAVARNENVVHFLLRLHDPSLDVGPRLGGARRRPTRVSIQALWIVH